MKVDKDVPLPTSAVIKNGRSYAGKYPFAIMEVGDSFFVSAKEGAYVVGSAASAYGKRHGKKFTSSHVDGGTRVWRVA